MKNISRSEARYKIMTILYQVLLYEKNKVNYNIDEVIEEQENANEFVQEIVKGVISKNQSIRDIANNYLVGWTIDRLGYTDQAILEMAIYEMTYTDIDKKIVIDEAIELAKKYSDEAVVKMINGALDKVYHKETHHES